jgi:hypothetical protein
MGGAMLALALRRNLDLGPVVVGADYLAGFSHQVCSETAISLRVPPLGSNPTGQRKLKHRLQSKTRRTETRIQNDGRGHINHG